METWVISLQERPDRLDAFRARADTAKLDVAEYVVPRNTIKRDGWGGSLGACGCAQSHLQILESGTGPVLVFEDDAMVPPTLDRYIELALDSMPPTWELLLLGAGGLHTYSYQSTLTAVLITRFALTHAYYVSELGRPHLAECARRASWHWDHFASRRMCARKQVYGYVPTIVIQDPGLGSDTT